MLTIDNPELEAKLAALAASRQVSVAAVLEDILRQKTDEPLDTRSAGPDVDRLQRIRKAQSLFAEGPASATPDFQDGDLYDDDGLPK